MARHSHRLNVDIELIFEKLPVQWTIGRAKPSRLPSAPFTWLEMTVTSPREHVGRALHVSPSYLPIELQREIRHSSRRLSARARSFEVELIIGHLRPVGKGIEGPFPERDAWQLLREFFRLKHGSERLVEFLNECGDWSEETDFRPRYKEDYIRIFSPDQFWHDRQKLVDRFKEVGTRNWKPDLSGVDFPMQVRAEHPHLFLRTRKFFEAAMHSVTLEFLSDSKFKLCKKPDCRMPFKVRTAHERLYCGQPCAHHESIRRSRAKKINQKSKNGQQMS
jgi:hypothetical protein